MPLSRNISCWSFLLYRSTVICVWVIFGAFGTTVNAFTVVSKLISAWIGPFSDFLNKLLVKLQTSLKKKKICPKHCRSREKSLKTTQKWWSSKHAAWKHFLEEKNQPQKTPVVSPDTYIKKSLRASQLVIWFYNDQSLVEAKNI